ncbi:hypothetical protein [Rhizobium leguminosarum]|uniref:hypothetical protein n=1 Tax=Rhizobium leguminosarum TaxID=384 RepID=UPI001C9755D9|nr:hypothetical protein [Rhizobium leguminosarum]
MNGPILAAATLAITFSLAAPQSTQAAEGAQAASEILGRISASRIVVISDGDFLARTYGTAELAPRNAGYRDLLTIMSPARDKIVTGSIPVSNSVTSAPEILARISQSRGCIGPKNLRNFFCNKELSGSWTGSDANTVYSRSAGI